MNSEFFLWKTAPHNLRLVDDEVNVFAAPLDVPATRLEELGQWLSEEERQRVNRFHFDQDRRRFIAGRGTLREILGVLLNVKPARLGFSLGEFGKPRIATPVAAHSFHFNLAHADSVGVYAIARHELGVDIERIRILDEAEQIAASFFSQNEREYLLALPVEQRGEAFFNCWTRKEAYLKAVGCGLGDCLSQVAVSFAPDEVTKLSVFLVGGRPWSFRSLIPAAGFIGALAIRIEDVRVHCWNWSRIP